MESIHNKKIFWSVRRIKNSIVFQFKKVLFIILSKVLEVLEFSTFKKAIIKRTFLGIMKCVLIIAGAHFLDNMLLLIGIGTFDSTKNSLLSDIIIGEIGVSGVILGLYCGNISNVYTTKYANAPERVSLAFQFDKLTNHCISIIIDFLIFNTILMVKILLGISIGWVSVALVAAMSIIVVISFTVAGNRTYQLSNIYNVANDAHSILYKVIAKRINMPLFVSDDNYQDYFLRVVEKQLTLLSDVQQYGKANSSDSNPMINFMGSNLGIIEEYWRMKGTIPRDSLWFRAERKYQKWHLADFTEAHLALRTGTPIQPKSERDYWWLENELLAINKRCITQILETKDYGVFYKYLSVFNSMCDVAINCKEANYYLGEVDWLRECIEKIDISNLSKENQQSVAGITELLSVLYLDIIVKTNQYYANVNLDDIYNRVIRCIDSARPVEHKREVRGRVQVDLYKKIAYEITVEGRRITPDWLVKKYVRNEEYVYLNSLIDIVKECMEHVMSVGNHFIENNAYYSACIILVKFFEFESKLAIFNKLVLQTSERYMLNDDCVMDNEKLKNLNELLHEQRMKIPELLLKCGSRFTLENWKCREEYPDFLGECYNHICEDTVDIIIRDDIEQFILYFDNLTKLMLLYQDYIRTDFVKNKDLYRVEYAYFCFTSPIVEWAMIGGLAILWGEFHSSQDWGKRIKELIKDLNSTQGDLLENIIEYVKNRERFWFGIGEREFLETGWKQRVEDAIKETCDIETTFDFYGSRLKTDSNLLNAFCGDFFDFGFSSDPAEVFWVTCINPLLPDNKKYSTRYSWERKLDE